MFRTLRLGSTRQFGRPLLYAGLAGRGDATVGRSQRTTRSPASIPRSLMHAARRFRRAECLNATNETSSGALYPMPSICVCPHFRLARSLCFIGRTSWLGSATEQPADQNNMSAIPVTLGLGYMDVLMRPSEGKSRTGRVRCTWLQVHTNITIPGDKRIEASTAGDRNRDGELPNKYAREAVLRLTPAAPNPLGRRGYGSSSLHDDFVNTCFACHPFLVHGKQRLRGINGILTYTAGEWRIPIRARFGTARGGVNIAARLESKTGRKMTCTLVLSTPPDLVL